MNDYISRETVLSKCQQIWNNADETAEIGVVIINIVDELANFVKNIPTADVQPVKHGRWERRTSRIYACTECTNEVTDRQRKNYSFCPYCGVLMDGGSE